MVHTRLDGLDHLRIEPVGGGQLVEADALRGLAPAQVKLVFDALHRMRDNLGAS